MLQADSSGRAASCLGGGGLKRGHWYREERFHPDMLLRQRTKRKVSAELEPSAVMSGTVKRVVDNDGLEKRQAGCSEV